LTCFTPVNETQCKVTLYQYADAAGLIPTRFVNSALSNTLGAMGDLRDVFQRDDEIDKAERDELARVMKDEPQVCTEEEDALFLRSQNALGALKEEDFEEIESPDHLVKMELDMLGSAAGVGRAATVIDASTQACAAWELAKMSREQQKKPSLLKTLTAVNSHNHVYHTVVDIAKVPGFSPREFVLHQVWRQQDAEHLLVVYDSFEHADYPLRSEYVRGVSRTSFGYAKLPPVGGVPQTLVTFTAEIDMGGNIPRVIQRKGVPKFLSALSAMRKRFDKSLEVDGAVLARNVEMITGHTDEYSEEENRILAEGERHFTDFQGMIAKSLKMASPLTSAKIAYKSGDSHAWGWSTTTVRASPEEVLAFLWDTMRRGARRDDDLEKSVEERVNGHSMLVYNKKRTPNIVRDWDFLCMCVWKREGEGFLLVTSPEVSDARPITDGVVRGEYQSALRIKRKNDKETNLMYVIHPDFGSGVPSIIVNCALDQHLGRVTDVQEHFQALRGLEEWDADDARAVGEVMCIKTKAEKHPEKGENKQSARIRVLVNRFKGLKEIADKYEFFEGMMERVVRSTLKPAGDVKSKLCSVSLKEGEMIGRGLAMALATNLTAEAAVDEWVLKYKSLGELDRTEAWFR